MKTAFIAAEYNPFHNGHKYQIEETRKNGADFIVAVMSGNFVQRGEPASAEKHIRAKAALMNGADLILELPLKFAVSNAEYFAEGFVKTAYYTGLEGFFSFGAGNTATELKELSEIISDEKALAFAEEYSRETGASFPSAMGRYIEQTAGKDKADMITDPNNILAVEYIKAIKKICPDRNYTVIKRKGAEHDSSAVSGDFASAAYIREQIYNEYKDKNKIYSMYNVKKYIPENVYDLLLSCAKAGAFPSDKNKFSGAALSRLYEKDRDYFLSVNNVKQGLENRIVREIKKTSSYEVLADRIKCKRYTHSRIRQILMASVLGIKKENLLRDISYIRVLGFNSRGRELLKIMKDTAKVPVIMNLSEISGENPDALLDYSAGRLYNLTLPVPSDGNTEYDIPPVII